MSDADDLVEPSDKLGTEAVNDHPDAPPEVTHLVAAEFQFQGPLPHPGILAEYEELLPGAAERILTMAETSLRHGQEMERSAMELNRLQLSSAFARANRGLNLGALVAIIIVAGGAFMAHLGYPEAGGGVIGGTIIGLAATFVYGARIRDRQQEPDQDEPELDSGS